MQDKESEKNPFLVTIKADLVHLAIMGFNFINIMMIIFSFGKLFLYIGQNFSNTQGCWLKRVLAAYFALFCQSDQLHQEQ